MRTGVLLLNFGEPARATLQDVVPFLERIFRANADLEHAPTPEAVRARCRELARRRAPALIAEYDAIGGSSLNAQSEAQGRALAAELERRGLPVQAYIANQFADPLIPDVLARARAEGVERLVALPVYPLCGPSTNVAALAQLRAAVDTAGWNVPVTEISGWHCHPDYIELRAEGIRRTAAAARLDLDRGRARLVFSAHGTPLKYLQEGSRYARYTDEHCAAVARRAGIERFALGFQNHGNRPIEWTQPSIDRVIEEIEADAVLVVPISFMHEQSETLSELDIELRREAEGRGLKFHRVPVPYDDPRFGAILADLVQSALAGGTGPVPLYPCRCRPTPATWCTNAG